MQDAELNKVYKTILAEYKQDKVFLEKLKNAQKAWLSYRDAHAESIFPETDKQMQYGSAYGVCNCGVMETMTLDRTKLLKKWLTGIPEGDVCSGSVKTK